MRLKETDCGPRLVVMLTHNDMTVMNAREVFESSRGSKCIYWGMKEAPLPLDEMSELYSEMRAAGITTVLEVVSYGEEDGLRGAEMAAECGCDILMGTKFYDSIAAFCAAHNIRYMPFVGRVEGRPSVLYGDVDEIVAEANDVIRRGAWGVDLLGYRYVGDAVALNREVARRVNGPVCIAGSIDSFERLDEVKDAAPWGFTIGSAFFRHCFGDDFKQQVNKVIDYLNEMAYI